MNRKTGKSTTQKLSETTKPAKKTELNVEDHQQPGEGLMSDSTDDDEDYEETEYLVYADFKNHFPPHQLKHEDAAVKIIGIESDSPVAEINGHIFRGSYDFAMGTNLFFQKDSNAIVGDPLYESVCRQHYKYVNKCDKVINFDRVYIENLPKEEPIAEVEQEQEEAKLSTKLNITYKEAINSFGED
ncbi:uncharacterized protein Dwil_GK23044 [Drosophila willistoni]|uniref:Transcription factor TFIIIC triple barrel domain-containing protein n=1 Tax=Drosophila willistoni TaxID=7260 RepID=B4NMR1_DROWI|nr:uncharacterized protein LOC6652093 [Drosophila willistoni]EDW85650.2 uncharacterized protein Dwil_GK23044 [Drosophila willistoni]